MELRFNITCSFLDENWWNKLQINLHSKIYHMHPLISWIGTVENWPSMMYRSDFDAFRPWHSETDVLQLSYDALDESFDVNCARSSWKLELPLMNTLATVFESAWKPCCLASIQLNYAHGWRIDQEWCNVCAEKWRKVERKSWRIFGSRSQFPNSVMISQKTVRIRFIYVMLNMLLITISQNAHD